jgi:hypothetical protein
MLLADDRWIGPHGIGRFASEICKRLPVILTGVLCALRPRVYFSPGFKPPVRSTGPCVFTIHDLIHLRVPAEASQAKQPTIVWWCAWSTCC